MSNPTSKRRKSSILREMMVWRLNTDGDASAVFLSATRALPTMSFRTRGKTKNLNAGIDPSFTFMMAL